MQGLEMARVEGEDGGEARAHKARGQEVGEAHAVRRVLAQHAVGDGAQLRGVLGARGVTHVPGLLLADAPGEHGDVVPREGPAQGEKLVEHHAQGPHVGLGAVGVSLHHLRREVVWRSDAGLCEGVCTSKHTRDAEVAELDEGRLGAREEDVGRLYVAVQHMLCMHVGQGVRELRQPRGDLRLAERLLRRTSALDRLFERAARAVLSHNVERGKLLRGRRVVAVETGENVGVAEHAEDDDLVLAVGTLLGS
mmetsp:Transcript_5341/g.15834  ORF Transcript_5341/g.15834 Transcript_5341/m.15834 type:complete len:251 (-) Transcript_5341:214-966(-)